MKKEIIEVNGGVGRVIALSGVLTEYAKINTDKEVDILTGYPELFYGNPYFHRIYSLGQPYIFEDVIKDREYINLEPYNDYDYYNQKKHLIEVYAKQLLGKSEFIDPCIYLEKQELEIAKKYVENNFKKPLLLFQPFGQGGGKYEVKNTKLGTEYTIISDPTNRSLPLPFIDKFVEKFKKDYDIVQIRSPNQYPVKGIGSLFQENGQPMPLRQIIALLPYVKGVVACDSFLPHAAKLMNTNAIVFWGATYPENLGYKMHTHYRPTDKFVWLPNRQPHNNPDAHKINKNVMNYLDTLDLNEIDKIIKKWECCDKICVSKK